MFHTLVLFLLVFVPMSVSAAPKRGPVKTLVSTPESYIMPLESYYRSPQYKGHFGYDLVPNCGCRASVKAMEDGEIIEARFGWNSGYGNTVLIKHANGIYTRYAHLSRITMFRGPVAKGQEIGFVGNTGNAWGGPKGSVRGLHLHYEVYRLN